jgi:hypothetical protein
MLPVRPDAADDLVDMQQDIVLGGRSPARVPNSPAGGDHATAGGDGFEAEAADRVRTLAQDHLLDRVGSGKTVAFRIGILVPVLEAMRHHDEARSHGSVLLGPLRLSAGRQRRQRGAVIVTLPVEDLVFAAAMVPVRDLPDHLEGLLVGLRSGVRVIDPAHARHFLDEFLGEQRTRDRSGAVGEIVHLDQLVAYGIGNALPAIADIDRPDAA